jgi:hypothetical protein
MHGLNRDQIRHRVEKFKVGKLTESGVHGRVFVLCARVHALVFRILLRLSPAGTYGGRVKGCTAIDRTSA